MKPSDSEIRAAFKKWALREWGDPDMLERDEIGYYNELIAGGAWEGWQAAFALLNESSQGDVSDARTADVLQVGGSPGSPTFNRLRPGRVTSTTQPDPTLKFYLFWKGGYLVGWHDVDAVIEKSTHVTCPDCGAEDHFLRFNHIRFGIPLYSNTDQAGMFARCLNTFHDEPSV